jgi:hypothetical protein
VVRVWEGGQRSMRVLEGAEEQDLVCTRGGTGACVYSRGGTGGQASFSTFFKSGFILQSINRQEDFHIYNLVIT